MKYIPTIKVQRGRLKIYLNGILHVNVPREHLSFQSWVDKESGLFYIEYYHGHTEILTGYAEYKLWVKILKLLDTI